MRGAVRGPDRAALWQAGIDRGQPTGLAAYLVAEALAAEQLALGHNVVVDAVNASEPARDQWRQLARRTASVLQFIEVRCSDEDEHLRRLNGRNRNIEGFYEPSWQSVQQRRSGFVDWADQRLVFDSVRPREHNTRAALEHLAEADQASASPVRTTTH